MDVNTIIVIVSSIVLPLIISGISSWINYQRNKIDFKKMEATFKQEKQTKIFTNVNKAMNVWFGLMKNSDNISKAIGMIYFEKEYRGYLLDELKAMEFLMQQTMIYGNEKVVKTLALYQEYNYKADKNAVEALVIYSLLTAFLKEQVTGEKISPQDLLKIQLNDYKENSNEIEKVIKQKMKILE